MKSSKNAAIAGNVARLRIRIAQLMGADVYNILSHLHISIDEFDTPELYLDAVFDHRVLQAIDQQTGT